MEENSAIAKSTASKNTKLLRVSSQISVEQSSASSKKSPNMEWDFIHPIENYFRNIQNTKSNRVRSKSMPLPETKTFSLNTSSAKKKNTMIIFPKHIMAAGYKMLIMLLLIGRTIWQWKGGPNM